MSAPPHTHTHTHTPPPSTRHALFSIVASTYFSVCTDVRLSDALVCFKGLATKQISGNRRVVAKLVLSELLAGALTASAMCFIAFFRVRGMAFLTSGNEEEDGGGGIAAADTGHTDAIAIAASLFIIVLSSTLIGTVLPLAMYFVRTRWCW